MPDYQMMTGPAFIFLEWVILILLIFAILSGAGGLWWVYRDGRRGRKDLHEKIESFVDIIRAEMKEAVKPAQDGIEAHIKECRQLRKERRENAADRTTAGLGRRQSGAIHADERTVESPRARATDKGRVPVVG